MRASGWRRGRRLSTLALTWLATASHADVNVTVAANAHLFRAGGNAPELAGANPRRVDLAPGDAGEIARFVAVAGATDCDGAGSLCAPTGPDGSFEGNASPGPIGAISAIAYRGGDSQPLLGVFLGADLAHPLLDGWDFRHAESFTALAPGLGEPFWIGDGKTGTGSGGWHAISVPIGATRLFLGFHSDTIANATGSLAVQIAVPEPHDGGAVAIASISFFASAQRRRPWRNRC